MHSTSGANALIPSFQSFLTRSIQESATSGFDASKVWDQLTDKFHSLIEDPSVVDPDLLNQQFTLSVILANHQYLEESKSLCIHTAQKGHEQANLTLATFLMELKETNFAIECYFRIAEKNEEARNALFDLKTELSPDQQTRLGLCFKKLEQHAQAYELFNLASSANIIAKSLLGLFISKGLGCPQDLHKGFTLIAESADAKDFMSTYRLAQIFQSLNYSDLPLIFYKRAAEIASTQEKQELIDLINSDLTHFLGIPGADWRVLSINLDYASDTAVELVQSCYPLEENEVADLVQAMNSLALQGDPLHGDEVSGLEKAMNSLALS
ncbi:MAG: hypothetical protein ACHQUC_00765 [Chlamydiales bacterium]